MSIETPEDMPSGNEPMQPIGTPPGGGEWTWDAERGAWVEVNHSTPE